MFYLHQQRMHFSFAFQTFMLTCLFFSVLSNDAICQPIDVLRNSCLPLCLEQKCDLWTCGLNSSFLEICSQSCYGRSCSNLSCNEFVGQCTQYCDGCKLMMCNSSKCEQRCGGQCNDITCNSNETCVQSCHRCNSLRCHSNRACKQTCLKSDCLMECAESNQCLQNCYGRGCIGECSGNDHCIQTCHTNATCGQLVCDSRSCLQKCDKNSKCTGLRCTGQRCTQSSFVKESTLNCSSSVCIQNAYLDSSNLSCENTYGSCQQLCLGRGCSMNCGNNVKTCEQKCDGGFCNMICPPGIETCEMHCGGGGCTFFCNANRCFVTCEGGRCESVGKKRGKCSSAVLYQVNSSFLLLVVSMLFRVSGYFL